MGTREQFYRNRERNGWERKNRQSAYNTEWWICAVGRGGRGARNYSVIKHFLLKCLMGLQWSSFFVCAEIMLHEYHPLGFLYKCKICFLQDDSPEPRFEINSSLIIRFYRVSSCNRYMTQKMALHGNGSWSLISQPQNIKPAPLSQVNPEALSHLLRKEPTSSMQIIWLTNANGCRSIILIVFP